MARFSLRLKAEWSRAWSIEQVEGSATTSSRIELRAQSSMLFALHSSLLVSSLARVFQREKCCYFNRFHMEHIIRNSFIYGDYKVYEFAPRSPNYCYDSVQYVFHCGVAELRSPIVKSSWIRFVFV
jgi:hypothetical protein